MMKFCSCCEETKSKTEFNKRSAGKDGLQSWCRSCMKTEKQKWNKENYEKIRNYDLKKTYGIDLEKYNTMLLEQNSRCKICGVSSERDLDVDHDHITGDIRGLLCNACNIGLGWFRDDPDLLKRAIDYVVR